LYFLLSLLIVRAGGPTGGKQRAVDTGPRKCYKLVRKDKKMKTLKVKIRNVYGQDLVYPACESSKLFAFLTKSQTLSDGARRTIKQLGYVFEVLPEVKNI
jgi:hypothetical protein